MLCKFMYLFNWVQSRMPNDVVQGLLSVWTSIQWMGLHRTTASPSPLSKTLVFLLMEKSFPLILFSSELLEPPMIVKDDKFYFFAKLWRFSQCLQVLWDPVVKKDFWCVNYNSSCDTKTLIFTPVLPVLLTSTFRAAVRTQWRASCSTSTSLTPQLSEAESALAVTVSTLR